MLALVALTTAAAVAFGTHPRWVELPEHGLEVILWSRRLQWVLSGAAMAACLGLVAMVVGFKKSPWWLAILAPVLALFAQRFAGDTALLSVADEPAFVEAAKVDFVADGDSVVCLKFADKLYAYPYAALYLEPVLVQADHDRRLALFWNAGANRVTAFEASADWRARDLEIVSTPANAVLVYNTAHAQFVVGVTGLTVDRKKPTGLGAAIATTKTTFAAFRAASPAGLVMKPGRTPPPGVVPPTGRIEPIYAAAGLGVAPSAGGSSATTMAANETASSNPSNLATNRRRAAIVGVTRPIAVDSASLSGRPALADVDDGPVVLVRVSQSDATLRAFGRKIDDAVAEFIPAANAKSADAYMLDPHNGATWSANGVAVGGSLQMRGRRLSALPVDDDVDYAVMKWWVPELQTYIEPQPPPPTPAVAEVKPKPPRNATKRPSTVLPKGASTVKKVKSPAR